MRISCKDVRGPHRPTLNSSATSVARLRLYELAIVSRFRFFVKICSPAIFDFCNTIGPKQTLSVPYGHGSVRVIGVFIALVVSTNVTHTWYWRGAIF